MFTGIVESAGTVSGVDERGTSRRLTFSAPGVGEELAVGDSIAVNGVCLTVTSQDGSSFSAEAVGETLDRSNLGGLRTGDRVNLERPMPAAGRFDGHIVQGHVDGIGTITSITPEGDGARLRIEHPPGLGRYLVEKGSVTVDGVSLTVASLDEGHFEIAVIPHTLQVTVLGERVAGDAVNLEVDVIAKYVERMIGSGE